MLQPLSKGSASPVAADPLRSVRYTADYLSVSPSTLVRLRLEGLIPLKLSERSRNLYYRDSDIRRYLAEREARSKSADLQNDESSAPLTNTQSTSETPVSVVG